MDRRPLAFRHRRDRKGEGEEGNGDGGDDRSNEVKDFNTAALSFLNSGVEMSAGVEVVSEQ